jgi:hypothetical protein
MLSFAAPLAAEGVAGDLPAAGLERSAGGRIVSLALFPSLLPTARKSAWLLVIRGARLLTTQAHITPRAGLKARARPLPAHARANRAAVLVTVPLS